MSLPAETPDRVGIFVAKGMTIGVPQGGLSIRLSDDGALHRDVSLHVHYDVCPTWLDIAIKHLLVAEEHASKARSLVDLPGSVEELREELEQEFAAGMQAATAAVIAIDAFYAVVKDRIALPKDLTNKWSKNGTARYRQAAEVFRRAFLMGHRSANQMSTVLGEVFRFRDQAVHPSGSLAAPHFHPELKRAMEWRFVTFRYSLVKTLVSLSISVIAQLVYRPRPTYPQLVSYCSALQPRMLAILHQFERQHGRLFPRATDGLSPPDLTEDASAGGQR